MEDLGFLGSAAVRLISETFVEARHLDAAFDDEADAKELLGSILPASTSGEFLDTAAAGLMRWKKSSESFLKRQRKLKLDHVGETLLVPLEPSSNHTTLEFEQIIRDDPKVFLEMARRSQKKASESGTGASRAEKEEKERQRYALELATIIEEACLPVSLQIVALDKPELAWLRMWGSRRAKTLRNRFRTWNRFRSWLLATYGLVWPKDVSHVVNFVEELIDYGCPISFPSELMAALSLLEQVGKVQETKRISLDPLLAEHLKSWKVALTGQGSPRGAARPYTVAILIALELLVVSNDVELYHRFVGWLMLVANWASLRVDDVQNIQPETVRLSMRGLSFRISKTKTTGPGRLHGAIHGFVAREISITGEDWMVTGILALQRDDMRFPRDYLAPAPRKDFQGFVEKLIEPPELANHFRMVLGKLLTPRFLDGKWVSSEQVSLVPETMVLFWTGHSARHFATQAAAAIGIGKERRDYLGRWSVGRVGSDSYLHTSRQVVETVQREILEALHLERGGFNEDELLEDLKDFAVGYRVRRRHKLLPLTRVEPLLMMAEDSEDSDQEQLHQRRLEADRPAEDIDKPEKDSSTLKYYVTISRRNGFRRLHMVGACPVQAWKCQEMEEIIDVKGAAYDAVCMNCKRKIEAMEGMENNEPETASDDDSSSTATEGGIPEPGEATD